MAAASPFLALPPEPERRLVVPHVPWSAYQRIGEALGDAGSNVRLTYLEGTLELLSPSRDHEALAKLLARLVEAFADERGVPLNGYKSTTFLREADARGLEPDECYARGALGEVPEIALDVVLTSGLVDKLEVYRGLAVPEVWVYRAGALTVYRLQADRSYSVAAESGVLPELDVALLASFVRVDADQSSMVRSYREALRKRFGGGA